VPAHEAVLQPTTATITDRYVQIGILFAHQQLPAIVLGCAAAANMYACPLELAIFL
jgi:hypothetical protein